MVAFHIRADKDRTVISHHSSQQLWEAHGCFPSPEREMSKCLGTLSIFQKLKFLLYSFARMYLQRELGNHIKSLIYIYATYPLSLSGTLKGTFKLGEEFVLSYLFILAAKLDQLKLPLAWSTEKTAWAFRHLDLLEESKDALAPDLISQRIIYLNCRLQRSGWFGERKAVFSSTLCLFYATTKWLCAKGLYIRTAGLSALLLGKCKWCCETNGM